LKFIRHALCYFNGVRRFSKKQLAQAMIEYLLISSCLILALFELSRNEKFSGPIEMFHHILEARTQHMYKKLQQPVP
jgi:hypothetical protein